VKKIVILQLCFALSCGMAHANILSIGPRVGVSISRSKVNLARGTKLAHIQLKDHWSYHVGGFTRLALFTFYVQPEVLFTNSGATLSKHNKAVKLRLTKLDVPTMLGLSLFGVARAQLGPVFSRLLRTTEGDKDVKEYDSGITVGWQGGLGLDLWKIVIDLKYEGNLRVIGNEIAGIRTNRRHAMWVLSVGVNML
jgi:hypothetical protein